MAVFSNLSTSALFFTSHNHHHHDHHHRCTPLSFSIVTRPIPTSFSFHTRHPSELASQCNRIPAKVVFAAGSGGGDAGSRGGGGGGGGGGDGDDAGSQNRTEAILVLAEEGRSLESLPKDLAAAIEAGRVPGSIVRRYFELEKSAVFRWLLQFGGFKERLLADDLFLAKVYMECGVGIFTKVSLSSQHYHGPNV